MARDTFEHCLALVLKHEGGFVDHPRDPGGATNRGITRATLAAHRGRPVSVAEVRALTLNETAAIYRARYWNAVRGDELPAGLDLALFDCGVHSGPGRAVRLAQGALGLRPDGIIGPLTLAAAARADADRLIGAVTARRLAFLHTLSTWPTFGRGWDRRVRAVALEARMMARGRRDA